MKYIRVYESDCYPEEYVTTYLNHCEHVVNLQNAGFDFEGCIVKQADTIEELCDEYCLKGNDGTRLVYNRSDFIDLKKDILANDGWVEIYGAIWTDKGLIYVAKMNNKGELELL